jgi:hypothetical protein
MFIKMAGIEAPYPPPVKIAVKKRMEDKKSNENVNGNTIAIAIET